jgi:hypothetical protein
MQERSVANERSQKAVVPPEVIEKERLVKPVL